MMRVIVFLCVMFLPFMAWSFEIGEDTVLPGQMDPVEVPKGFVAWQMLDKVTQKEVERQVEGGYQILLVPTFSDDVKKLSGQEVKVKGFLFPLEEEEKQKHFLLSAYPPSCAFCLPAGPSQLIEITLDEGIDFTYDPLLISGKLTLLEKEDDLTSGMFYRIDHATIIKE